MEDIAGVLVDLHQDICHSSVFPFVSSHVSMKDILCSHLPNILRENHPQVSDLGTLPLWKFCVTLSFPSALFPCARVSGVSLSPPRVPFNLAVTQRLAANHCATDSAASEGVSECVSG